MDDRISELIDKFNKIYGKAETPRIFAAPGRVNMIGEHIDYCGGFVFPAALTLDTLVAVRPCAGNIIKVAATDLKSIYEIDLNDIEKARSLEWGNYQAGVIKELKLLGYRITVAEMLFDSTIPLRSGLSSSASIELATGIAIAYLAGREPQAKDKIQLALAGQKAENNFCGVNCGIMDQFASAMGLKDHGILLDCANLKYEYVPLKLDGYRIVLANTCKKRGLAESKYNERRSEVEEGFKILSKFLPGRDNLCAITPDEFESFKSEIKDPVIEKRVRHVIYENKRVLDSVEALKSGDLELFAQLMHEANDSIRYLYEVTGFELDTMVDEANSTDGCIAARMTGAGFGGCTVNIVKSTCIDSFIESVGKNYHNKTGITPQFYVSEIGDGARELV